MPFRPQTTPVFPEQGYRKPITSQQFERPDFFETTGAAFRQENDVYNVLKWAQKPAFSPEEGFDVQAAAKSSRWGKQFFPELAAARSRAEFSYIEGRIAQEQKDKLTLGQAGATGFIAAMAAGVLSPTSLIPGMGPARGVRGAMQAFGLAAGATAASEAALYATQETRTVAESLVGVAAGTVLGGLLGTAARHLTPDEGYRALNALRRAKEEEIEVRLRDGTVIPLGKASDFERGIMPEDLLDVPLPVRAAEVEPGTRTSDPGIGAVAVPPRLVSNVPGDLAAEGPTPVVRTEEELDAEWQALIDETPYEELPGVAAERFNLDEEEVTDALRDAGRDLRGLLPDDEATKAVRRQKVNDAIEQARETARQNEEDYNRLMSQFKTPDAVDETGMAVSKTDATIRDGDDASLSAAEVRPRNTGGAARPRGAAAAKTFDLLSKLGPVTRLYTQRFSPSARYWISRIQNPGLKMAEGRINADDGTIFSRRQMHQATLARFIREYEDAYWRHLYGDAPVDELQRVGIFRRLQNGTLGLPEGKMNRDEFGDAVFDALNTGVAHDDAAVNQGAASLNGAYAYYRKVAADYAKERSDLLGTEVKPLFSEDDTFLGIGVQNYVTFAFDKNYIVRNADEFLNDFATQGEYLYKQRFDKSFAKFRERRDRLEALRDITKMSPEELKTRFSETAEEIEALQNSPEYLQGWDQIREFRDEQRALLSAEGWAPEDLTKELGKRVRQFSKDMPETWRALEKERKALMRLRGYLRAAGGEADEATVDLTRKVLDLQAKQDAGFEKIAELARTLKAKQDRLFQAMGEEDIQKAAGVLQKALDDYAQEEGKINNLIAEKGTAADGSKLWAGAENLARRDTRIAALRGRLDAAKKKQLDAGTMSLILEEAHRVAISMAREKNYRAALKEKNFLDQLEELSDEALAASRKLEGEALTREIEELEDSFDNRWRAEGAEGPIVNGEADFATAARDNADELFRRLTGSPDRAVGMELVGAKRGSELKRVLAMPYEIRRKYLIRNPEDVLRRYGRTMDPDLELWRITGSVNGAKIFDEIKEDFAKQREVFSRATHISKTQAGRLDKLQRSLVELGEKSPLFADPIAFLSEDVRFLTLPEGAEAKGAVPLTEGMREGYSRLLSAGERKVAADMQVVIDRLRHDRGYPADANAIGYRLGRATMNLQVTTMMGKVLPASFPDVMRPWAKYGAYRTLKKAWVPFATNKAFRQQLTDADKRMAIGLDPLLHNRAQAFADLYNTAPVYSHKGLGMFEKSIELLANRTGLIAMFDYWTAMMKHLTSSVAQVEMADNISILLGRVPSTEKEMAWAKQNLQRLGVSDEMARRFDAQMALPGGSTTFEGGLRLPNTENWEDPIAYRAYNAIVLNEVDNIIITPGLDLPTTADQSMPYRLLYQFRSFTFASNARVHMSMLQGNDPYRTQFVLASLAIGALSYYTWAATAGEKSWKQAQEADPETIMYEALDRSGLLGVAGLGTRVGEQVPGLSDWWIFGGEERTSRRGGDIIGAIGGPAVSNAQKLGQVLSELDQPTTSTANKMRQLFLPYQNHFLFDRALDGLGGWATDTFDLPETRARN